MWYVLRWIVGGSVPIAGCQGGGPFHCQVHVIGLQIVKEINGKTAGPISKGGLLKRTLEPRGGMVDQIRNPVLIEIRVRSAGVAERQAVAVLRAIQIRASFMK